MAKIPLRAYLKEIENYIDRGEIDQAVTHAKNILKSYPKHIDTYRLLGKAYLESQQYSEAADILQRVLSVLPDDFISHIGMSIIREDEGNLNAAIWHMERAYEVQPFNPAVQDELRRLYGRRDGVEPPKIRLTRGALVRMYARGELYPQAIAETRAALAEDPQRQDLQVLLARLYYLSGHKNDAAEICSELLRKLPYCYEANRLLAEFLPTTNRAEEAQKFQQRMYALDPYAAFISPNAPTSDQVPDQVVMVEQFTWEGAMEEAQAPDWTRNAGVAWQDSEEEEVLPDWLDTLKPETLPSPQAAPEMTAPEMAEPEKPAPAEIAPTQMEAPADLDLTGEDLIPDWMKDQGWTASERKADEIMASEEEIQPGEIAPADLPDWVQSIAPQDLNQPAEETERTEWLDQILAQPGGTNGKEQALPDWGTSAEPGAEVPLTAEPSEGELPDWLSQLSGEQPSEGAPEEIRKPAEFEGLPDWSQLGEPSTGEPVSETGETPDWLRALEPMAPEPSAPSEQTPDLLSPGEPLAAEPAAEAGIPNWLQSLAGEETEVVPPEAKTPQAETRGEELPSDLLPDWLKPEEQPAAESAAQEVPAQQEAAPQHEAAEPWELAGTEPEAAVERPEETVAAQEEAPGGIESAAAAETPIAETAAPDFSDMDAAMAWLESLAARQGADEATLVTPPDQRTEEPPEWLKKEIAPEEMMTPLEMAEEQPSIAEESAAVPAEAFPAEAAPADSVPPEGEAAMEQPGVEAKAELPERAAEIAQVPGEMPAEPEAAQGEAAAPDFSDMDAAMAWLESLAARQGADEATLVTPPEQRIETPPEWVRKEMETGELTSPEESAEVPAWEQPEQAAEPEIPFVESAEPAERLAVEVFPAAEETASVEPEVEQPAAEQPEVEQAVEEQPATVEAPVPDWLQEIQPAEEEAQPEEKVPEWLATIGQEETVESPLPQEETPWKTEEQTVSAEQPAAEPLPDWLMENAPVEPAGTAAAETVPAESEAIPDWLQNLGEEGEPEAVTGETQAPPTSEAFRSAWEPEVEVDQPSAPAETITGSLTNIQAALNRGDLDTAMEGYSTFIQHGEYLNETIHDLRDALYRYPVDINIWQTLGDAYARNNQLQEALDAYTKAEELLR